MPLLGILKMFGFIAGKVESRIFCNVCGSLLRKEDKDLVCGKCRQACIPGGAKEKDENDTQVKE